MAAKIVWDKDYLLYKEKPEDSTDTQKETRRGENNKTSFLLDRQGGTGNTDEHLISHSKDEGFVLHATRRNQHQWNALGF